MSSLLSTYLPPGYLEKEKKIDALEEEENVRSELILRIQAVDVDPYV
jgi:hypothetical protein